MDFIRGGFWPLQTYGWSGTQWGPSSDSEKNAKSPTSKPPMIVTSQPPGAAAIDDETWGKTFGATHDCVLSILNGTFIEESTSSQTITGIYKDAMPHLQDMSLLRDAKPEDGDPVQQVQYMVSKKTVAEAQAVALTSNAGTESEIRSIGMRMPMMMAGWGKTIALRPTDPEPTKDDNKRKNDEEHKLARETWKHGAVDLRWDERRGVWAGWNDLIADNEGQNLGTFIFSTNPDTESGFPFIRGRLEDFLTVRGTKTLSAFGKISDTATTGGAYIKLQALTLDTSNDFTGSFSQVLVNHDNFNDVEDDSIAGEKIGSEETKMGGTYISSGARFYHSPTHRTNIAFTEAEVNPDNEIVGIMKKAPASLGGGWRPVIELGICGDSQAPLINNPLTLPFSNLFANDLQLDGAIDSLAAVINGITFKPGGGGSINGFATINLSTVAQSASTADQNIADSILAQMEVLAKACEEQITLARQDICAQVNLCLEHLGCICVPGSATIAPPNPFSVSPVSGGNVNGPIQGSVSGGEGELIVPGTFNQAQVEAPCFTGQRN